MSKKSKKNNSTNNNDKDASSSSSSTTTTTTTTDTKTTTTNDTPSTTATATATTTNDGLLIEDAEEEKKEFSKDAQGKTNKDLANVAAFHEEKVVDETKVAKAMTSIFTNQNDEKKAERIEKMKEMATITIKDADVKVLVKELKLTSIVAENLLREHKGSLITALTHVTHSKTNQYLQYH